MGYEIERSVFWNGALNNLKVFFEKVLECNDIGILTKALVSKQKKLHYKHYISSAVRLMFLHTGQRTLVQNEIVLFRKPKMMKLCRSLKN